MSLLRIQLICVNLLSDIVTDMWIGEECADTDLQRGIKLLFTGINDIFARFAIHMLRSLRF